MPHVVPYCPPISASKNVSTRFFVTTDGSFYDEKHGRRHSERGTRILDTEKGNATTSTKGKINSPQCGLCDKGASFAGVQCGSYVSKRRRNERAPDGDKCAECKVLYAPLPARVVQRRLTARMTSRSSATTARVQPRISESKSQKT